MRARCGSIKADLTNLGARGNARKRVGVSDRRAQKDSQFDVIGARTVGPEDLGQLGSNPVVPIIVQVKPFGAFVEGPSHYGDESCCSKDMFKNRQGFSHRESDAKSLVYCRYHPKLAGPDLILCQGT